MKGWFVFKVTGKQIAVWAGRSEEAEEKLRHALGSSSMEIEYVGLYSGLRGISVDEFIYEGMTPTDIMIASGFLRHLGV